MIDVDKQMALIKRGAAEIIDEGELRKKLSRGTPLKVKVGFDPTAPDLHLGHTVIMQKMRHFRNWDTPLCSLLATSPAASAILPAVPSRGLRSRRNRSRPMPRPIRIRFSRSWIPRRPSWNSTPTGLANSLPRTSSALLPATRLPEFLSATISQSVLLKTGPSPFMNFCTPSVRAMTRGAPLRRGNGRHGPEVQPPGGP